MTKKTIKRGVAYLDSADRDVKLSLVIEYMGSNPDVRVPSDAMEQIGQRAMNHYRQPDQPTCAGMLVYEGMVPSKVGGRLDLEWDDSVPAVPSDTEQAEKTLAQIAVEAMTEWGLFRGLTSVEASCDWYVEVRSEVKTNTAWNVVRGREA
jgi:hypothetical protein